jgi:hypothetical protein
MYKHFQLHPVLVVSMILICSYFGFHPALGFPDGYNADGVDMRGIQRLSSKCRENILKVHNEIKTNLRKIFNTNSNYDFETRATLSIGRDYKGNFSVHFYNAQAQFGSGYEDGEKQDKNIIYISNRLAPHCPEVQMFAFNSAGSWLAWTLRKTNFKQIHGRGSGLPGDYDKYWNWNKLPLDYNPYKNYFPGD